MVLSEVTPQTVQYNSVMYRNLQLCPLIPEHALFAALPWVEKVEEAVSALLLAQGGTALCYLSQTFWKPALQVI